MNTLPAITTAARPQRPSRFDAVAIGLHWLSVVLLIGLFASAWSLGAATGGQAAGRLLTIHRSLGATAWVVAICRLGWRARFATRPPLPPSLCALQRRAAAVSEAGLYALLLIQPLTGLAQSLARGRPFPLFAVEIPKLMARDKPLATLLHQAHGLAAWVLLGLIGLHVCAALMHRFVLRDAVLQSMLPWPQRSPQPEKIVAVGNKRRRRTV